VLKRGHFRARIVQAGPTLQRLKPLGTNDFDTGGAGLRVPGVSLAGEPQDCD
jgi:hypothetical protein